MRAAKYLSVCLLSLASAIGLARLDTGATPEASAIAVSSPDASSKADTVALRSKPEQMTKSARELQRFYTTARLAQVRYKWGESRPRVARFQQLLQIPRTGVYDNATWTAHKAWLAFFGSSDSHLPNPPLPAPGEVAGAGQRCPQYESIALAVGWPAEQIPKLSYVMWRESRCLPTAHNPRYPDDSYGLIQLNMLAHRGWVGPIVGWDFNRLYDPYVNLSVGLQLWHKAGGWGPWRV